VNVCKLWCYLKANNALEFLFTIQMWLKSRSTATLLYNNHRLCTTYTYKIYFVLIKNFNQLVRGKSFLQSLEPADNLSLSNSSMSSTSAMADTQCTRVKNKTGVVTLSLSPRSRTLSGKYWLQSLYQSPHLWLIDREHRSLD
jgi:hypothetical protein